jgi:toxin-antitoxin system PIN domain toxin
MKLVDLNVLLYAVNRDAAQHQKVRAWWAAALGADEPVGLTWIALLGFLRLATSAQVFPRPLRLEQAIERVEAWLAHPNTRLVRETEDHWRILKELLEQSGTAGNLTTDGHLAALAISHGATLASCDADFARFRHLRWENPVAP